MSTCDFGESGKAHTELAAGAPEGLRVEVGGVHAVRGRVDAGELPLVELDEGSGFLLHHLVGFGLAERRHLPAAVGCTEQDQNILVFCVCSQTPIQLKR